MASGFEKPDINPANHEKKEKLKKEASLKWGKAGHEFEWVLNLEGFGMNDKFIPGSSTGPDSLCGRLNSNLPEGFHADNRGTRIEIFTPDSAPHYKEVTSALENALQDEWEGSEWQIDVENEENINSVYEKTVNEIAKKREDAKRRLAEAKERLNKQNQEDNNIE